MQKKGKLEFKQGVGRDGNDFIDCQLKSFDTNTYYFKVFKENYYQADSELYEKTLALNNKNVLVDFERITKYQFENVLTIQEVESDDNVIDIQHYKNELKNQIKSIKTKTYRDFINDVFLRNDVSLKFFTSPASETETFAYRGGLLQKTVNSLIMIDYLSEFMLENVNLNIEFLKVLAITTSIGAINAYEFIENSITRTPLGMHFSDKELSLQILMDILPKHENLSLEEKNMLLHTALNEDTIKGKSDGAKIMQTLILNWIRYGNDLFAFLILMKQNRLNDEEFMKLFKNTLYVGNL